MNFLKSIIDQKNLGFKVKYFLAKNNINLMTASDKKVMALRTEAKDLRKQCQELIGSEDENNKFTDLNEKIARFKKTLETSKADDSSPKDTPTLRK